MEKFTSTTKISIKECVAIMYKGLYRKPVFILATFLGLAMLGFTWYDYTQQVDFYISGHLFEFVVSLFLLLFPSLIVYISYRQFIANPSFRHEMTFTFDEKGIAVAALTCNDENKWEQIIRLKEINNYLILYRSSKFGYFINKTSLTQEQVDFIKKSVTDK